ncbi:MAG: GNAT family N-acetyltransferase [Minicystis sp.]
MSAPAQVALRPYRPGDELALFEALEVSRAEVGRWMPELQAPLSLEHLRAWVRDLAAIEARSSERNRVVEDPRDGSLLGSVGLARVSKVHRCAGLFYWVHSGRIGRGVATAAIRAMATIAFEELGLLRVEMLIAVDNLGSLRAAEKAGAQREGLLRSRFQLADGAHDARVLSLLPGDLARDR